MSGRLSRLFHASLGLSLGLCVSCAPGPAVSPARPQALVVSDRGGAWRVYEIDPLEGTARLVGSPRADDRSYQDSMPARLPDGRIVFVSDRAGNPEIYLAPSGGDTLERLTVDPDRKDLAAADSDPAPLGRDRIVFARGEPGAPGGAPRDLFVLRPGQAEARRLTRAPADDHAPWGSPDGRQVVFVSDRSGKPRLYLMTDLESTDPESSLLDLSGRSPPGAGPLSQGADFVDSAPTFLPDGSIVFSRAPAEGPPHLYVAGPPGTRAGLRQITDSLTLPFGADEPVILPDRTILLVTGPFAPPSGKVEAVPFAVYRIATGGFNLTRVTRERAGYNDLTRRLSPRP